MTSCSPTCVWIARSASRESLLAKRAVHLIVLVLFFATDARAQEGVDDPLRMAAIQEQFPELASKRLVLPTDEKARTAYYAEHFRPVLDEAERLSIGVLSAAADKFRRSRIRLTQEERARQEQPFRIARDLRENLRVYTLQPIRVSGSLQELAPVWDEGRSAWAYEGVVEVAGPQPLRVRFLVSRVPEELSQADPLGKPVSVTGYAFPLFQDAEVREESEGPIPLIVGPRLVYHQPVLDPLLFADVKDRTLPARITEAERDVYYRTLKHARMVDYAAQQTQAAQNIQRRLADEERPRYLTGPDKVFVDIFKRTETYRGELVTMEGTLRKLVSYAAGEDNEYDLTRLYEAWVFPDESQSNPAVVIFTEQPAGLTEGDNLGERVRFTGYFLKMYAYEAQDTTRVAPMVLAQRIEVVESGGVGVVPWEWIVGGIGLLVGIAVFFVVYNRISDRRFQEQWKQRHSDDEPPPDLNILRDADDS